MGWHKSIGCDFNALWDGYETAMRGPGKRYKLVPAGANSVWSSPESMVQLDGPEGQEFRLAKLFIMAGYREVTVPDGRATLLRLRQPRTATAATPALVLLCYKGRN